MKAIIYKAKNKKWYAKIVGVNEEKIWKTGDGYTRRIDAVHAVELITNAEYKITFKK